MNEVRPSDNVRLLCKEETMFVKISATAIILLFFVDTSTQWIKVVNHNVVKNCEDKSYWNLDSKSDRFKPFNLDNLYTTSALRNNCVNLIPSIKSISVLNLLLYVQIESEESGIEILVFQHFEDKNPVNNHVYKGLNLRQGWNTIIIPIYKDTIAYIQFLEHSQDDEIVLIDTVKVLSFTSNNNYESINFDEFTSGHEHISANEIKYNNIQNDRQRTSFNKSINYNINNFNDDVADYNDISENESNSSEDYSGDDIDENDSDGSGDDITTTTETITSEHITDAPSSEQTTNPTSSEHTIDPTTSEYTTNPTPSEHITDPTSSEQTTDPTSSENTTDPTPSEHTTNPTPSEHTTDPISSEHMTDPTPTEPPPETPGDEGISVVLIIIIVVVGVVIIIVVATGAYLFGKRKAQENDIILKLDDIEPRSTVVIPRVKGIYNMDSISVTK